MSRIDIWTPRRTPRLENRRCRSDLDRVDSVLFLAGFVNAGRTSETVGMSTPVALDKLRPCAPGDKSAGKGLAPDDEEEVFW